MTAWLIGTAVAALLVSVLLGFLYGRLDGYVYKWWGGLMWVTIVIISLSGGISLAAAFALYWPTQLVIIVAALLGVGYILAAVYLSSAAVEIGR